MTKKLKYFLLILAVLALSAAGCFFLQNPAKTTEVIGTAEISQSVLYQDTPAVTTPPSTQPDTLAPVLTLLGDGNVLMLSGEEYAEPGFMAEDAVDGDLTAEVVVSGEIDYAVPGTYVLEYMARDCAGNVSSATRTVQVARGIIYLTFDDGPGPETPQLLDILKQYDVKATFFVVGCRDLSLVKTMAEQGHTVGNHSYSHDYEKIYANKAAFLRELERTEAKLKEILGYESKMIRFPGGSIIKKGKVSMYQLTREVEKQGYHYFDWNVDSMDARGAKSSAEIVKNVCKGVQRQKVSVVLMHDTRTRTVNAVEDIILWGLENGYVFRPLQIGDPEFHLKTRT